MPLSGSKHGLRYGELLCCDPSLSEESRKGLNDQLLRCTYVAQPGKSCTPLNFPVLVPVLLQPSCGSQNILFNFAPTVIWRPVLWKRWSAKNHYSTESPTPIFSSALFPMLPDIPSQELRGVWETAPMMFVWRFNEGLPAPGNIKQELHVDPDSKHRRRLYSRVLAEPALVVRGYSASGIDGGISAGGERGGETSHPASEGFTALMSNGDELLRLAEHCRVVVDNVVDAPPALLATGNIGKAALEWQKRISWFQVRHGTRQPKRATPARIATFK